MYSYTFVNCKNVKISSFGSSNSSGSKLTKIGQGCFSNAANGDIGPDITELVINHSVEAIDSNAFQGYAKNTLTNVCFGRPWQDGESAYGQSVAGMGFKDDGSIHFEDLE